MDKEYIMPVLTFRSFFLGLLLLKSICKTCLSFINLRHIQKNAGKVPVELDGVVNPEILTKIDAYQVANMTFHMAADWIGTAILLCFLFTPLFPVYTKFLESLALPYPVRGILFFLILGWLSWLLNLPLDFYYHFRLEARFGFNKYRLSSWLLDSVKGLFLNFVVLGIVLGFVFSIWGNNFSFHWRGVWFGWAATLVFLVILEYLVPVLIIPFFYKLQAVPDAALKEKITELVQKCGFKVRGVFTANESSKSNHANALFAGIGKSKTIILFDTLVNHYSGAEILGVLAHEIGHGKHRHSIRLLVIQAVEIFLFILLASLILSQSWVYRAMGIPKIFFGGCFFIAVFFFDGLFFFVQPLLSWYSRSLEFQADAFSKKSIGSGAPLVSTFKKFITDELGNIHPHPIYEFVYYSHPSLLKRIRALENQN